MSEFQIVAGDLAKGAWTLTGNLIRPASGGDPGLNLKEELDRLDLLNEEELREMKKTAGWGLAGLLLLGPVGAVGGLLLGGRKKQITFACHLKDGRKFMAMADTACWTELLKLSFDKQ